MSSVDYSPNFAEVQLLHRGVAGAPPLSLVGKKGHDGGNNSQRNDKSVGRPVTAKPSRSCFLPVRHQFPAERDKNALN